MCLECLQDDHSWFPESPGAAAHPLLLRFSNKRSHSQFRAALHSADLCVRHQTLPQAEHIPGLQFLDK